MTCRVRGSSAADEEEPEVPRYITCLTFDGVGWMAGGGGVGGKIGRANMQTEDDQKYIHLLTIYAASVGLGLLFCSGNSNDDVLLFF